MSSAGGRISNNEKDFIHEALRAELRVDGRKPFDVRRLSITFSKQDGAVEVQQGETRVMAVVTGQLGAPYPDRPAEGSLAIFTEFSPMADHTFEPGRPGELSIELGRIIDRGLRESRAVDTESLCVLAGQKVWALRVDIHILDNGGNLVDVANIAALAALLSYRRPECSVGGPNGQEVTVHPPQVVDPILKEEAVMGGRLTVTVNAQGDICAIQKGGGVGVSATEIMRCLRIASSKASEITMQLNKAVEANNLEQSWRKVKRHSNLTFESVISTEVEVQGDAEVQEVFGSSVTQTERTEAMIEIIKEEEMEEASSSDSLDEEDIPDEAERKKQNLGGKGVPIASMKNGVLNRKLSTSRKPGLFEGGPSFWSDDEDTIVSTAGSVADSTRSTKRPFDSDALAEFNDVADVITKAVVKSESVTAGGSVESKCIATMSAASAYPQMPQRRAYILKPLGPIFPKSEEMDTEGEQPLSSSEVLSGTEVKPAPTSLIDAVKRKRKKGQNM